MSPRCPCAEKLTWSGPGTPSPRSSPASPFTNAWAFAWWAAALNSLGTGGLLRPDKNPGSYMWTAVADPKTRRGVVAGWISTDRGSGVVRMAADGVTGAVGTITRSDDGTLQVTYNGLPLYFFFHHYVISPMDVLRESVEGVSLKNFDLRFQARSDELGELAGAVTRLMGKMKVEIEGISNRDRTYLDAEQRWWRSLLNIIVPPTNFVIVVDENNSILYANFELAGGMPAVLANARAGEWNFRVAVIAYRDDVYRIIFAVKSLTPEADERFARSIASLPTCAGATRCSRRATAFCARLTTSASPWPARRTRTRRSHR